MNFKYLFNLLLNIKKVKSIKITFSNNETLVYTKDDSTQIYFDEGYIDVFVKDNINCYYSIDQIVKIEEYV